MMNKNRKIFMSDTEKQNTALPGEVDPKNAFTKLSIFALRAANKYKLKNFKLEKNKTPNQ